MNGKRIHALGKKIRDTLGPLIDTDYVLLDVPNHRNIGDNLIWKGELAFLSELDYHQLYTANMHTCQLQKISRDSIILIHGGGNFGDLYPDSQKFKLSIIEKFLDNKIIIFPQTIYYKNLEKLKSDAKIINAHDNITICARDNYSFQLLANYIKPSKILLLPDMAFCLDFTEHQVAGETGRLLILERTDAELNKRYTNYISDSDLEGKKVDVQDWPSYGKNQAQTKWITRFDNIERKLSEILIRIPAVGELVDPAFGLKSKRNLHRYIATGISFINQYDKVITTRLHGFILAVLLNKKVKILDNSYGKNLNFYNTWLTDFKNIEIQS